MKKRSIILSIIVIILLIVVIKFIGKKEENKTAAGGPPKGMAVGVKAIVLKPEFLQNNINITGTILPNEEVELRSEISGRVTGIYFQEGAAVKKGQMLVKINDTDFQAQLKKVRIQEKLAAEDEFRKSKLLEIKGISQEEYDRALNLVNTLRTDADLLQAQIVKTEIRAPFNGVIGLRYISEGGFISPTSLVATMQDIDPVKVEFSVPEKYVDLVKKGSKIEFTITGKEKKYTGTVYAAAAKIDLNTRSLTVRATAPNPDHSLIPGAFVKIGFTLENIKDALMIPTEALVPELGGQKVFIVQNDTARSVKVETGIRTEKEVQVTSGLNPSDTVIITGLLQIRNNSKVKVEEIVDKEMLRVSRKTN
jgi:membrane fusion protein, multidrug efflux system